MRAGLWICYTPDISCAHSIQGKLTSLCCADEQHSVQWPGLCLVRDRAVDVPAAQRGRIAGARGARRHCWRRRRHRHGRHSAAGSLLPPHAGLFAIHGAPQSSISYTTPQHVAADPRTAECALAAARACVHVAPSASKVVRLWTLCLG